MSKITQTKLVRVFELDAFKKLQRRPRRIPATNRRVMRCAMCPEPMYVAPGQIAYTHRKCRAGFRNRKRLKHDRRTKSSTS